MTTGALIFAFNNEKTDYVRMAAWSAERIRRYLNIPVAVVTDSTDAGLCQQFEKVIFTGAETGGSRYFDDYADTVSWHNAGRTNAYSLSPFDQTLVLDSDYVVCGNQLKAVLDAPHDFLAFRNAYNLADPDAEFMSTFGRNRFPMWWATVMMFRKSNTAQYIFESMTMIKQNWQHYRALYGITEKTYRNDYALSIALGIVSGHTLAVDSIPYSMASVMPDTELLRINHDPEIWELRYTNAENKPQRLGLYATDFHAMGKRYLEAVIEAD
jgi:hypothetical protein